MNIIFSIYDKTFFQIIFTMLNSFQLNIVKISEITHFCKITEKINKEDFFQIIFTMLNSLRLNIE